LRALTVGPGGPAKAGVSSSPAIVDGRPAVAYSDDSDRSVKFVRAADPDGAAWGTPVTVVSGPQTGAEVCLKVVDGNPAVCYYDPAQQQIKFVRAADTAGSVWNAPVSVPTGTTPLPRCGLEIAHGNPAVAFVSAAGGAVRYVRAADAAGSAWGTPVTVDISSEFQEVTMRLVEGRPAVVYSGMDALWYRRASDAAGAAWDARVNIPPAAPDNNARDLSMQVVNGRPAVCWFGRPWGPLRYARALDSTGAAWAESFVLFYTASGKGSPSSLAVVNGRPSIAYSVQGLSYLQSSDIDGASPQAWWPLDVDFSYVGPPALMEVNGRPAIVYHDIEERNLKYLRATGTGPSIRWPAEFRVQDMENYSAIPDGGTLDFGHRPAHAASGRSFFLTNAHAGSAAIISPQVFIDGPDAAEFSLYDPWGSPRDYDALMLFGVSFAPATPGRKSAVLHATGTAGGAPVSFSFNLAGDSDPDIVVQRSAGAILVDGDTAFFPLTLPGATADLELQVRNTGGTALLGLAMTFDGPDAAEFSVASGPPPEVELSPDETASFTVRHTPSRAGVKTAALHIASNVSGSKNPYDLTLRAVPGQPDPSFRPSFPPAIPPDFLNPTIRDVTALAVQANGKILAGGYSFLERFNEDGSFDNSFFSPVITGGSVFCIALQKNGGILLGGDFQKAGAQPRPGLARLLTDGSLDDTFIPALSISARCLAVLPDGKILACGGTENPAGPRLLRLHPDGTVDAAFHPLPNAPVAALELLPDGKIFIAGRFQEISGTAVSRIARLHPNGTLDDFRTASTREVFSLTLHVDGRISVMRDFIVLERFFPDGSRDPSVQYNVTGIYGGTYSMALQADGRCLAGAGFSNDSNTPSEAPLRLNADGSVDGTFHSVPGWIYPRIALQADGRLLIAGEFTDADGIRRHHFERLGNDAAFTLLKTEGRSTVRWLRGGSAPEVRDVTFDMKPDGESGWIRLGNGTRISGGWELSALTLPATGTLRAQGYAGGSLIESVTPILTSIESWRLQYFDTPDNTGDAADDADPDQDGLTNFTEYAFGLNPVARASNALPAFVQNGNTFTSTFTAPEGREDLLYSAESSPTMLPGTWTALPDTGTGGTHVFSIPPGQQRMFVRFVVKMR
jgi:uncharacterized delta-60 repeat protein